MKDLPTRKDNKHSPQSHVYSLGDIVIAPKSDHIIGEGVVVNIEYYIGKNKNYLAVDFGDEVREIPIDEIKLIKTGLEIEVGDVVNAFPNNSCLSFVGRVININDNGTYNVLFDGEDEDDVENNISLDRIRKLKTGRELAVARWHKVSAVMASVSAFSHVAKNST